MKKEEEVREQEMHTWLTTSIKSIMRSDRSHERLLSVMNQMIAFANKWIEFESMLPLNQQEQTV
jgi:hypothetical protein